MARSQFARCRGRQAPARLAAGLLARAVASTVAGVCAAALPALAGTAMAERVAPGQPPGAPVSFAITGISKAYATPGRSITLSVQIRNVSHGVLHSLSVRILSSNMPFTSRGELEGFVAGTGGPALSAPQIAPVRIGRLAAGASTTRPVRVPVSALRLSCFGVYPLQAQLTGAAGILASDPMALPFWPGKSANCPGQRPKRSGIAWIWPLIDRPHQGACPGLLDNSLARSVAPGGRLADLLAVGRKYATSARLNWVIDPALLDNVRTMAARQGYLVGSGPSCGGGKTLSADPSAAKWLNSLLAATSGHTVIATPYADTDIAALTLHVRNHDPGRAFAEGQRVAGQILRRRFAPDVLRPNGRQLASVAWPADGIANYTLLENLPAIKISTVILDSNTMRPTSPVNYTPGAVTSTPSGFGTQMHVLLADDSITALLGSRNAASSDPGAIFGVRQLFLAETALIAAERPRMPRAIVVAPPRQWRASSKLAGLLLADTVKAPWLRPSTVGQLLALPSDHLARSQPQSVSPDELSRKLLRRVAKLDRRVALLESVRVPGDPDLLLYRAAFGIESSAWRGGQKAERPAEALLVRTSRYVSAQWRQLSVGGFGDVTLGGTVSTVRMHVTNQLDYPVRVKLMVTASNHSVRATVLNTVKGVITVPGHVTSTVKLAVTASTGGVATIRVSLRSPNGRQLPIKPLAMHIRATQFGTLALAICAAALAVFVIASAVRAIRMGRPAPPAPPGSPVPPVPPGPPPAEAGSPQGPAADPLDGAEKPDTVDTDSAELALSPAFADQGLPVPGHRPTEGPR